MVFPSLNTARHLLDQSSGAAPVPLRSLLSSGLMNCIRCCFCYSVAVTDALDVPSIMSAAAGAPLQKNSGVECNPAWRVRMVSPSMNKCKHVNMSTTLIEYSFWTYCGFLSATASLVSPTASGTPNSSKTTVHILDRRIAGICGSTQSNGPSGPSGPHTPPRHENTSPLRLPVFALTCAPLPLRLRHILL